MKTLYLVGCLLVSLALSAISYSQTSESLIDKYLQEHRDELGLSDSDIEDWVAYDDYTSKQSGVRNIYVRQQHEGIEVYHGVANFHIKNKKIFSAGIRLANNISDNINTSQAKLSPVEAIDFAASHLGISGYRNLKLLNPVNKHEFVYEGAGVSLENIPVKLMYYPLQDSANTIRLAWDLSIYIESKQHWWSMRVDAVTGEVLDMVDWVVECDFDNCSTTSHSHSSRRPIPENDRVLFPAPPPATDQYNVFAIPTESPTHGPRTLVVGPSNPTASPFGWHDDDGISGAEYNYTQGNNVRATEDRNNNNGVGTLPSGGAALDFNFPLDLTQAPIINEDAAITNLFYMNNIMHDVWYQYGFDEPGGNFQENSYGNGGIGTDLVFAEAQDGGGTNNANFATPGDGGNPRMQMYLWTTGVQYTLTINSPAGIAGQYQGVPAGFGPALPVIPITADLALVDDGTALPLEGCNALINAPVVSGKIAVVMRGTCGFTDKVIAAQNAGAVAVIVVNNVAGAPFAMGGALATISIPSIMVSDVDGALMIAQLQLPTTVNGTIVDPGPAADNDGDFDNGIVAHEYGHGISNRLAGGPSAANCLSNAEQMGEGWSDWFGLMLTIEPGDLPTDIRGIGTYAVGEPTTGPGIRPAPYSTDLGINNFTYDATNNTGAISQPHGIGFVWCTMLWDLNWALVNQYGYDTDIYNGTGGNNIAMALVIEGLKLQPCSPGFVDGRDGILAADQALYGGVNACLIWEVFAARGLGFSADQGGTNSRTDQVEAFDLPALCLVPTLPPIADFSFTVDCNGNADFTDLSTQVPNGWIWDFGDATSSTAQNPTHVYAATGTYTVTLTASNIIGSDAISYSVVVTMPSAPVVADENICENQSATFTGAASGSIIWYDGTGTIPLDTAFTYTTPILTTTTTYQVENVEFGPLQNVGPVDNSIGSSGYHNPGADFTLNFTAYQGFTINSVWIDANTTGNRTINIWDGIDATGTIIATAVVNITATGPQRITLDLIVPAAGTYSIGGTGMDLRRNNNGVTYPYTLAGVVDIISSSAGANYYYYYYDWEVQTLPCRSTLVPIQAIVNLPDSTFETVTACNDFTWTVNSTNYTASGTYTASLTNVVGCDSIATLFLTISTTVSGSESVTACDTYTWPANSTTYTVSGAYTTTLTAAGGCDSIATLNLVIHNATSGSEAVTACGSFTWTANATTYSASGAYTTILTSAAGCDSIATLFLTISTTVSGSESVTACGTYTWPANSTTYTVSGAYTTTLTAAGGCDSITILNLTINNATSGSEAVTACGSFTWTANATTYSASGAYTTILTSAAGCDSIAILNLTINNATSGSEAVSACDSYTWLANGTAYTASGAYTVTLINAAGCDSIVTLNLTINSTSGGSELITACDSYTWSADGTTYTVSGTYSAILTNSAGCDSSVTLFLTINSVDASATQLNPTTLSANTSGATYQWIDCATNLEVAGETGQTFTTSIDGNYAVVVTLNGCSDTSACLLVSSVGLDSFAFDNLTVYPNPTNGEVHVSLGKLYEDVSIRLVDVTGKLIALYDFNTTEEITLFIEEASGLYFMEISSADGHKSTVKVQKK